MFLHQYGGTINMALRFRNCCGHSISCYHSTSSQKEKIWN